MFEDTHWNSTWLYIGLWCSVPALMMTDDPVSVPHGSHFVVMEQPGQKYWAAKAPALLWTSLVVCSTPNLFPLNIFFWALKCIIPTFWPLHSVTLILLTVTVILKQQIILLVLLHSIFLKIYNICLGLQVKCKNSSAFGNSLENAL